MQRVNLCPHIDDKEYHVRLVMREVIYMGLVVKTCQARYVTALQILRLAVCCDILGMLCVFTLFTVFIRQSAFFGDFMHISGLKSSRCYST
jgi:hypothetical protein